MRAPLLTAVVALLITSAPVAANTVDIHAHRGGTVVDGQPTYAEESLGAYRAAARNGFVFEVDAKLTRDGVPVAVHDATLDRTTSCTGEVRSYTRAALRRCRPDVLGSPGGGLRTRSTSRRGSIPTVAEVLELARLTGSKVNLEIKNVPTDPDWDPTSAYANRVMDVVLDSGLPRSQLLIQSFIPANLDVARRRLRGVPTSLLALSSGTDVIDLASDNRYDWISPQWPVAAAFVRDSHRARHPVAPYTLNTGAAVRAAGSAGVDAVITDDPLMAARALGQRPIRGMRLALRRQAGRVEAAGRLRRPARTRCTGTITLRVLGAKRTLYKRSTRLRAGCRFSVAVTVPRGAPARLLATIGFGGNAKLLPRLVGPRAVPREVPLAVPHER
jgi:glycerophosphoryl diester phosphodiesterase